MSEPVLNSTASARLKVAPSDLASALNLEPGDSFPPVFATSRMVALMEVAAARVLGPHLAAGEVSVGVSIDVVHTAATPPGATVTATAKFVGRDGKLFLFELSAADDAGEIGKGTHKRAIVASERIVAGAAEAPSAELSRRSVRRTEGDPRVHDREPLLVNDDRVQVHLVDLRVPRHEVGDLDEKPAKRRNVGGPASPDALEELRSPGLLDHLRRVLLAERHDPEGDVLEDLDESPPHAEHDGMPELEITGDPDDDLRPGRGHGAHEDSPVPRADSLHDAAEVPEGLPDSRLVPHVQDHSSDVALVRHVDGVHLHRDGVSDLPRRPDGLLLVPRLPRGNDRQPLAHEEADRVGRGERPRGGRRSRATAAGGASAARGQRSPAKRT